MSDFFIVLVLLVFVVAFVAVILYNIKMNKVRNDNDNKAKILLKKVWNDKYTTTKRIGNLYIDEKNKSWYALGCGRAYGYADIIDFEIVENGTKYKLQNGVTRAVIGGLAFGAAGAVVGANTAQKVSTISSMSVNIIVNNSKSPLVSISLISDTVNTSSATYKNAVKLAQQIIAQLSYMRNNTNKAAVIDNNRYLIDTRLVGITSDNDKNKNIQTILPTLKAGSKLLFVREPNNEYDKNAIKVICDYQHIGYVKTEIAEKIAPLIDSGRKATGQIIEIIKKDEVYNCKIHISI